MDPTKAKLNIQANVEHKKVKQVHVGDENNVVECTI